MNPFRKQQEQAAEPMGPVMVAVFMGRGSPEMCMQTFGYLMEKLRMWGSLKTPDDVVLHNAAMEILKEMRAGPSLVLSDLAKLKLEIAYERIEDAT